MEFATIVVGILGSPSVSPSGRPCSAIVIGNGSWAPSSHAVLSSWGPNTGLCQMVLSRRAFGFLGNCLPAG